MIAIILSMTYAIYRIVKLIAIKPQRIIKKSIDEKGESKDFLSLFIKPQKLSKEEVSIFKEKKICLVCKGKVLRFNSFICECDTLYCENCAQTLSKLENACWVCNVPFDQSKPSKPYEKEEEKITIKETFDK